jgi:hypothetical protein
MVLDARSVFCKVAVGDSRAGAAAEYNSVPFGFFDGLTLTPSLARVYCYFRTETWDNDFSRLEIWSPTRAVSGEGSYEFSHRE